MKLKLKKLKSYNGVVTATKKNPIVEVTDEKVAMSLVKKGYFEIVEETEETGDEGEGDADGGETGTDYEALNATNKTELAAYAEQNGISIEGCTTKAQILEAISEANGGNSTMIDLQQA